MITRDQAITIARERAVQNGWGLREPVGVRERRYWSGKPRLFFVFSDPSMLGTKSRFTIDAATGAIVEEAYLPR